MWFIASHSLYAKTQSHASPIMIIKMLIIWMRIYYYHRKCYDKMYSRIKAMSSSSLSPSTSSSVGLENSWLHWATSWQFIAPSEFQSKLLLRAYGYDREGLFSDMACLVVHTQEDKNNLFIRMESTLCNTVDKASLSEAQLYHSQSMKLIPQILKDPWRLQIICIPHLGHFRLM